jgi:hypothetical protein
VLTGTPTPTPPNLATIEPVVLPWKPTPANEVTAAAIAARETAWATTTGTATATPAFAVTATPRYIVVTQTATPENAATAAYRSALATAHVVLTGTPTPKPPNLATATFTPQPTATPVLLWLDRVTPGPTPTFTPSPTPVPAIPRELKGKIAFLSDRDSSDKDDEPKVYVLDPNTGRVAMVTDRWPYDKAMERERYSPDREYVVGVRDWKYQADEEGGQVKAYQVHVTQLSDGFAWGLTFSRISYDPVWSPRGDLIAYVSQEEEDVWNDAYGSGGDEIYVITPQGKEKRRLTENVWEWDKHPTFSPDGSQIVFWSNRVTGRRQLWIMNVDGSEQRILLESRYNDWDPVWIK